MIRSLALTMILSFTTLTSFAGQTAKQITHPTCVVTNMTVSLELDFSNDYIVSGIKRGWYQHSKYRNLANNRQLEYIFEDKLRSKGFIVANPERYHVATNEVIGALGIDIKSDELRKVGFMGDSYVHSFIGLFSVIERVESSTPNTWLRGLDMRFQHGAQTKRFKLTAHIPASDKSIAAAYDSLVESLLANIPTCKISR